jgi:hypothetical protein
MKITIEVDVPEDMDLEHTLECLTDAMYYADCVTIKEEDLVIQIIQELQKQLDNQ